MKGLKVMKRKQELYPKNSNLLRNDYIELYKQLRKFVWSIDVIQLIADLEIGVFTAFPDIEKVKRTFQRLKQSTYYIDISDESEMEEYRSAFDTFENTLKDYADTYLNLDKVNEVVE